MRFIGLERVKKVYFIGIYGVSMSALAKLLSINGYKVSGSDERKNEESESLAYYGVTTFVGVDGNRAELLEADLIVFTDAIPQNHLELVSAISLKKRILRRAELLENICKSYPHTIAVAGSHVKTTCSSMCAHILKSAGVPFTAHIGGDDFAFSNFYTCGDEYFLTEACEYTKNIQKIRSETAVLLNIDLDHMECYGTENELVFAFENYCKQAKTTFICGDDERSLQIGDFPSFSIKNPTSDYRAVDIKNYDERYGFTIEEYGKKIAKIRLKCIGKCNIYNALAAFSCMRSYGFSPSEIKDGLESFTAVKRRFEKIGLYKGAECICDYAHHPKEIISTLKTARGLTKGRLLVVFQPHTFSRTKALLNDFVSVLQTVDNLLIYKTYAAREKYDYLGSGRYLSEKIGSLYADNLAILRTWLDKTVKDGDTVLFLGAGDIYYLAQYLIKEIK